MTLCAPNKTFQPKIQFQDRPDEEHHFQKATAKNKTNSLLTTKYNDRNHNLLICELFTYLLSLFLFSRLINILHATWFSHK